MIKDLCFEIIQKCPNNCMFCSSKSSYQKDNIIDFTTIKRTIDFFVKNGGIKEISLSGGEPLLHPNIFEIIEYCHNYGIFTTVYTSGIVRNTSNALSANPHFEKILNQYNKKIFSEISIETFSKLNQAGLNKVVFDMQASEVDEYNALMGTKNNFTSLLKSMLNASKFNFATSIHFIPNKVNCHQFKDVFELAEIAGIEEVRVLKFVPQGRGRENKDILQLNNDELLEFLEKCSNIKSERTKLKIGIPLQNQNNHKCTAGFDKIDIRYDGQILPCPAFKDTEINLLKRKGFNDINIYRNLDEFKFIENASRVIPLCEQIYEEL